MFDADRESPQIPGDLMPESIAKELQMEISRILGKRGTHFPGSQPVSFQASHIEENLERRDYFVCEKTDGLRCLMFCILDPEGNEAVFLITRENQFYRVPNFHFPLYNQDENTCHNGTIIDGELVLSKNPNTGVKELRYLMFDCLAINQLNLTAKPLHKRLGYLDQEFFKPYFKLRSNHPKECEVFPFKLNVKPMHPSYKLPKLFDQLKYLGHISDGLIFTCCETPYIFGTDPTLLKWKPAEENTIDFRIHLNIPVYVDEDVDERDPDRTYPNYDAQPTIELHVWHGDNSRGESTYTYFADLSVTPEEWEKLKALEQPLEERIAECNKEGDEWHILRFRDDKTNGNHVNVVKSVLQSIKVAITKEQLIEIAPEIEQMWHQRELEREKRQNPNFIPPIQPKHRSTPADDGPEEMPTYAEDGDDDSDNDDDHANGNGEDNNDDHADSGSDDDEGPQAKKARTE